MDSAIAGVNTAIATCDAAKAVWDNFAVIAKRLERVQHREVPGQALAQRLRKQ